MSLQNVQALSVNSVSVAYGTRKVINKISLDVGAGEIFGLMGLNGVGKTTLIKAILGLRDYQDGAISVYGRDHRDQESRNKIAYLPERFDPPWFLSGMEFIRFSLGLYKAPFNREEVEEAAAQLALNPAVLASRAQTYSKGMRQKLGLLGTLLTGAPLLILDEPMSGLDPLARARVKDALVEAQRQGRTVFLSSHILSDMNEICQHVAVLNDSRIVFAGTPSGLCETGKSDNIERAFLNLVVADKAA